MAFAFLRPARTRSTISERSSSAIAPMTWTTEPAESIVSEHLSLSTSPRPKTPQMTVSRGTPGNAEAVQPAQNQIQTPSAAPLSPAKEELATGVTAIEKKVAANQPVTVDEVNVSTRYLIALRLEGRMPPFNQARRRLR